jgi:hypothetical protein
MERLKHHRQIIQDVLTEYHQLNEKSGSKTESALAFDEVHDQYLLLLMGWHKDERIKSVMIHPLLAGWLDTPYHASHSAYNQVRGCDHLHKSP